MGATESKGAKGSKKQVIVRRSAAPVPTHQRPPHGIVGSLAAHRQPSTEPTQTLHLPSAGLTVRYAYASQRGYYPNDPTKSNQDALCVLPVFGGDKEQALFGVFDGHGEFGMQCAQFAGDKVAEFLQANLQVLPPDGAFVRANMQVNAQLHQHPGFDDSLSGTTAVAALLRGRTLFVSNVGDSRCVLAELQEDKLVARDMSVDQTPFRRDECERVKRCGARVLTLEQLEGNKDPTLQYWGTEDGNNGDPPRVWAQNATAPGTAFTRSIGDSLAEKIGVIAEPEVVSLRLAPSNPFLVIASDGVWEFMSSQTVVNMVATYDDPQEACLGVVAEAARLWLQHETRTDDITIIILQFQALKEDALAQQLASSGRASLEVIRPSSASQLQLIPPTNLSRHSPFPDSPTPSFPDLTSLNDMPQLPSARPSLESLMVGVPASFASFTATLAPESISPAAASPLGPASPGRAPAAPLAGASPPMPSPPAAQGGIPAIPAAVAAIAAKWHLPPSTNAALASRSDSFSYAPRHLLAKAAAAVPSMAPPGISPLLPHVLRSQAASASVVPTTSTPPQGAASSPSPLAGGPGPTGYPLEESLQDHPMFSYLPPKQLQAVMALFERQVVQAGDTICHEGSSSDYFYMVGHGQFDARVQEGTAASSVVATFACQPGATAASFGELSLLYPQPWQYSVVARTLGMLWALHRSPYRQLLQQFDAVAVLSGDLSGTAVGVGVGANGTASTSPKQCACTLEPAAAESELESLLQVLRNVEVLRVLAPSQLYRLVAVMEQKHYSDGQYIIHEGDEGDDFFLMQDGVVACMVAQGTAGSHEALRLTAGQYFGERALVAPAKRAASVVSQGPVTLRRLGRAALETALGGSLQDVSAAQERWREACAVQRRALAVNSEAWAHVPQGNMSVKDLAARGLLFSTDYSAVMLMEHLSSQEILTVRVVSVTDVVDQGKQSQVLRARDITRSLEPCLFIPGVLQSYKDSTVLAEVLMTPGLCTLDMLLVPHPLDNASAVFVAASVVLALEHLAWSRVIFRGLSVFTILITEHGQVQLVDFRFARRNDGRAYTLCGNPEYLAPEVIEGRSHDESADLWALGVLIHDMLVGQTPFADIDDDDELQLYGRIVSGAWEKPAQASAQALDLIDKLLQSQPSQRLGAGPLGMSSLKAHPWFAGIDWQALSEQRLAPPAPLLQRVSDFEGVECAEFDPKPCSLDTLWINDF